MMEKKRPKRGKNSYLNDFHPNLAGEYIYEGAYFTCRTAGEAQKKLRSRLWAAAAAMLLCAVAGGCIPAPGMRNCAYVLLPYVGELLAAVSVVWAFAKLGGDWARVREYTYERSVTVLPRRAALAAGFSALGAAAETVFLLHSGGGDTLFAAVYYLLKLLVFVCAVYIRRAMQRTDWENVSKNGEE